MLPIEKQIDLLNENSLIVVFDLPAKLGWFAGHFDIQPVLPGVAQIEWAIDYATRYLAKQYCFKALDQIKFLSPIQPEDRVQLCIEWQPKNEKLTFKYFRQNGNQLIQMSTGKISLCQS